MGRKYMGSGFGGRKSLIRMIADRMDKKSAELEKRALEDRKKRSKVIKSLDIKEWNRILAEPDQKPKEIPSEDKAFIFDILRAGDKIIIGTIEHLLNDYIHRYYGHIGLHEYSIVIENQITTIDRVGLVYSKNLKALLWLGFNSSDCYIIFSSKHVTSEDFNSMNILGLDNVYSRLKSNEKHVIVPISEIMRDYPSVIDKQDHERTIYSRDLF